MKVLVGCEFSGIVREAFAARGHLAWSCDFEPTEIPGPHIVGDVLDFLDLDWDLAIFHPPCTYLAISGARWMNERQQQQKDALDFVWRLMNAPIPQIALENPVSVIATQIRPPDQYIQPYEFGHPEKKKTCLWLKNLPLLLPTNNVEHEMLRLPKKLQNKVHYCGPTQDRQRNRSRTYTGIAKAMAEQWG